MVFCTKRTAPLFLSLLLLFMHSLFCLHRYLNTTHFQTDKQQNICRLQAIGTSRKTKSLSYKKKPCGQKHSTGNPYRVSITFSHFIYSNFKLFLTIATLFTLSCFHLFGTVRAAPFFMQSEVYVFTYCSERFFCAYALKKKFREPFRRIQLQFQLFEPQTANSNGNVEQRIEYHRHMPARVHAYNKLFMTSVQRQLKTPTLYQKSNKEEAARLEKSNSKRMHFVAE